MHKLMDTRKRCLEGENSRSDQRRKLLV